jgi:hypothetical protein
MTFLTFVQTYYPCGNAAHMALPCLAFDKYCKQSLYKLQHTLNLPTCTPPFTIFGFQENTYTEHAELPDL